MDRAMWFVERSMEATDLLNEGQAVEALPILEELVGRYGELDQDGYAAISLGDCLVMLNRLEEARRVYGAAMAGHPERRAAIEQKLTELDLAGPVSEEVIERLRSKAAVEDESRFLAVWQLGRALQKKALVMLEEAAASFKQARGLRSGLSDSLNESVHSEVLTELSGKLGAAIEDLEGRWQRFRQRPMVLEDDPTDSGSQLRSTKSKAEWTVEMPDGRTAVCRLGPEGSEGGARVTVNGRSIGLTKEQAAMIRLHRERIEAIIGEAATKELASERR